MHNSMIIGLDQLMLALPCKSTLLPSCVYNKPRHIADISKSSTTTALIFKRKAASQLFKN